MQSKSVVISVRIPTPQVKQGIDAYIRLFGEPPATLSAIIQTGYLAGLTQILGPDWPTEQPTPQAESLHRQLRTPTGRTPEDILTKLASQPTTPTGSPAYQVPTNLDADTTQVLTTIMPTLQSGQLTPIDQLECPDPRVREAVATWILAAPDEFDPSEVEVATAVLTPKED